MIKNIPNILSLIRIIIALAFPFALDTTKIIFLTIALLTEYLDGFIARHFNCETTLGQLLDPLADKLLALSIGLTFIFNQKITPLQFVWLIVRDMIAALGFLYVLFFSKKQKPFLIQVENFKPHFLGKTTTVFQYLVFFDLLLSPAANLNLINITGFLSLMAGLLYIFNFYKNSK